VPVVMVVTFFSRGVATGWRMSFEAVDDANWYLC